MTSSEVLSYIFFFNDTATTEIYTLSLHDALPILSFAVCAAPPLAGGPSPLADVASQPVGAASEPDQPARDRKSTRLNSSHVEISYAVFCLKKKKTKIADVNITDLGNHPAIAICD